MAKDDGFDELYNYVKSEILNYDKNQSLPSSFVLRLKGLAKGKFIENKKIKDKADYSYDVILNTFKAKKKDIIYAIEHKDFDNEQYKFNYIIAIVQNNINDIYLRMENAKKQKESINNVEINIEYDETKYKRKTDDLTNQRLKDIW